MAEKGNTTEPSSSKTVEDILEECLGLASETFDPMRIIYAPSLEAANENVEVYKSVSQFMKDTEFRIEEEPAGQQGENRDREEQELAECLTPHTARSVCDAAKSSSLSHEDTGSAMHESIHGHTESTDKDTNVYESVEQSERAAGSDSMQPRAVEQSESLREISVKSGNKNEVELQDSGRRSARRNVLTQMENGFQQGPLSILRRSVQEKIKVRVWTRSVRNIRGISTGYVVAFDKHMNLAMIDVDEVYRKPVGKHQRKKKKPKDKTDAPVKGPETSKETEVAEAQYPNTPWQPVNRQAGGSSREDGGIVTCGDAEETGDSSGGDHSYCDQEHRNPLTEGIGNLPSLFSGMHVFEENKATRLLGVKTKKLLTRHLNQVLLRGDHVVAVSLVDLDL